MSVDGRRTPLGQLVIQSWHAVHRVVKFLWLIEPGGVILTRRLGFQFVGNWRKSAVNTFFLSFNGNSSCENQSGGKKVAALAVRA